MAEKGDKPREHQIEAARSDRSTCQTCGKPIAYLELPEGVTFVGSDSGLAFADRTDFIIRPGDPIPGTAPVPEPSSVVLGGTGLLALGVMLLRGSRCRKPVGEGLG